RIGKLNHSRNIDSIYVVDCSGSDTESTFFTLKDVHLDVQAYELHDPIHTDGQNHDISTATAGEEDEDMAAQVRVTQLPSKQLVGIWDSLIFDEPVPARLLRFTTRMMSIMKHKDLNTTIMNWNRLILLHGPPGTGKTSLCRALAQKLTIRLGRHFTHGKLVEVNSQTMLSKWFGESGKLVGKMFEQINAMADDEDTLVCVLIDEVETLTGSREKAASGNEVGDALRATNQLLTALDRLKHRPNVMVFCTSNLLCTIDSAFLDRVDIKQYIPNPCASAAYEILRSCFNEMVRCKLLVPIDDPSDVLDDDSLDCLMAMHQQQPGSDWEFMNTFSFPTLAEVNIRLWN
ncbi:hypothetical protein LTS18_005724, partial [Coniosporium uncinatum]